MYRPDLATVSTIVDVDVDVHVHVDVDVHVAREENALSDRHCG